MNGEILAVQKSAHPSGPYPGEREVTFNATKRSFNQHQLTEIKKFLFS